MIGPWLRTDRPTAALQEIGAIDDPGERALDQEGRLLPHNQWLESIGRGSRAVRALACHKSVAPEWRLSMRALDESRLDRVELLVLPGIDDPVSPIRRVSEAICEAVPSATLAEPGCLNSLPFFDDRPERGPEILAVRRIRGAIERADGVVIVTPEHLRSIPTLLKNGLDWAARPYFSSVLSGKPCAMICVTNRPSNGQLVLEQLRQVLLAADAVPIGQGLAVSPHVPIRGPGNILRFVWDRRLSMAVLELRAAVSAASVGSRLESGARRGDGPNGRAAQSGPEILMPIADCLNSKGKSNGLRATAYVCRRLWLRQPQIVVGRRLRRLAPWASVVVRFAAATRE